ncbi:BON1-associated protein 2-like [Carica papaya]|uniref:BON1-associated protein 2-like n=1 Tax=Carica papaya TaxID=3649 RepID=UPI000B8CF649|nr:BON1-associated protein 2-like [Carica papaya]
MSRVLEITVLSAEDLRIDRKSVKKNAYVTVKVDPFNYRTTRMEEQGGSYPSWNEKLEMDMSVNGNTQFIALEVNCRTSSGERRIGSARMPVTDFMGGYAPEGHLHLLSYRLRDERMQRNGIINVSVRVRVRGQRTSFRDVKSAERKTLPDYACSSQAVGYGVPAMERSYGGAVTGIPVWCAYQSKF